jgi:hypothetical protein
MAAEINDRFEQAFFLMVHLPYLQPFEDVNKRTSRLAANIPLIRIELLRDVFVWAYERSCQQYAAVKQSLVPPDIFRLRYRQALSDVVAAIIQNNEAVTIAAVHARLPTTVAAADAAHFTQLVLQEFAALHPGNAVRFGIRPLVFAAWKERHGGA